MNYKLRTNSGNRRKNNTGKNVFLLCVNILWLATSVQAQHKNINTVAGNGYLNYSGDGGVATAAQFYNPYAVAIDDSGNMYIADQGNNCIRKINTSGIVSTYAGTGIAGYSGDKGPAIAAQLNQPAGIVTDAAGNVYVSDQGNNRIRKISKRDTITTIAGTGLAGYLGSGIPATAAELNKPNALAIDASANIYVADVQNERIEMIAAGVFTTLAGKGTIGDSGDGKLAVKALLSHPTGVAIDGAGNIFIADQNNNRVREINAAGIINTIAGKGTKGYSGDGGAATAAQLYFPQGVGVDLKGNVYIADGDNRVRIINNSGIINTLTGTGTAGYSGNGGPAAAAQVNIPTSVIADDTGNIYITDSRNDVIRKIDTLGTITAIAGDGTGGYSGNHGPAMQASVRYPNGVAIDMAGTIYVADGINNVVRKITASGIISTIAGTGIAGYSGDGGPANAADLNNPMGVAIDAAGGIYITDQGNNCIRKIDTVSGTITTIAGTGIIGFSGDGGLATAANLSAPYGISVDAAGNIYFTDAGNYRVRKINTAGTITTIAGNGIQGYSGKNKIATTLELSIPQGITTDNAGTVYLADAGQAYIWKINTNDTMSVLAGTGVNGYSGDSGVATAAMLYKPTGVALDKYGNIYVSDQGNNCIRKIDKKHIIYTDAGTGKAGFGGDGSAAIKALLNQPAGIATDTAGHVFFADHNNNRIRELSGVSALSVNTVSVPEGSVTLYPNPNHGAFNLTIRNYELGMKANVEIYNMLGEKVYSQYSLPNTQTSINISNQPAGIYLYRVLTPEGQELATGKLIISR